MTDQKWFSVPEFAEKLGWSRRYVLELVQAKLIKATRRGSHFFKIPRSELIEWGLIDDDENGLT